MSYTLGFLKPDCLERKLEEVVYGIMEANGLRVVLRRRMRLDLATAKELYREWEGKDFYNDLCRYIQSGDVEVFIAEGDNAIERLQRLVGERGSATPSPGTIRERLALSRQKNTVHSTTNQETLKREAMLLLGEDASRWLES